jgi:4-hydroxybenzoate polyprenyltransferase
MNVLHSRLTPSQPAPSRGSALLLDLVNSVRPRQWIKNGFVFAALVFAAKLAHPDLVVRAVAAFLLFCALTSGVYLLNDIADREADRHHPTKANRAIASGRVPVPLAATSAAVCLVGGIALGALLDYRFGLLALGYVILMLAYTFFLKHLVLIDVFAIAGGFVIRAAAGAAVIHVSISPWLYLCTILISLFLGFGKRRHELLLLEETAGGHRRNLDEYTAPLLDDLINIVAGATIIASSLYTKFASAVPQNHAMMVTIPFVLYGIFRYLLLVHRADIGGAPEEAVWRDVPLLLDLVAWAACAAAILVIYK